MKRAGAGLVLALFVAGAGEAPTPLLRAEGWTPPGPSRVHDLTLTPAECLAGGGDAVAVGRALFRSPGILGGPAARIGLSCEACHAGGRVNARFLLPELSDAPGTADVTSAWTSKVRDDGVRNPVAIPDLIAVPARTAFGVKREALEPFVRGVIEEEFQGAPLPPAAMAGLIAYLRARPPSCADGDTPITLATSAHDVRSAFAAAERSARGGDAATASLLLYAVQDGVARIVERLPEARFARERATLAQLAGELHGVRNRPALLAEIGAGWRVRFDGAVQRLARRERATYFNPATLDRALTR